MSNPSYIPFGDRSLVAGGLVHNKYKLSGIRVINNTGSSIGADKPVAILGYNTTSKLPRIVLADGDVSTHKDIYVALQSIANGAEGIVFKGGLSAANLNTNTAAAAGDPVYMSTTAGGFAHTAPTTGNSFIKPIGWVVVKSATVGQIHWHIGEVERTDERKTEIVTATNVIDASETGTTYFLNSATEFISTLPPVAAGLQFNFIVTAAPSGASYTIVTDSSANVIKGQVYTLDVNSATDADFETSGGDTISFVDSKSVAGDRVQLFCDGTNWFAYGFCSVFDAVIITTAS